MKLQIDADRLRFRLSEDQLDLLRRDGRLVATLVCPTGERANRVIVLEDGLVQAICDGDLMDLRVRLPRLGFEAFAAERPRRDGFSFTTERLAIDVEVDVRDSRRKQVANAPGD